VRAKKKRKKKATPERVKKSYLSGNINQKNWGESKEKKGGGAKKKNGIRKIPEVGKLEAVRNIRRLSRVGGVGLREKRPRWQDV